MHKDTADKTPLQQSAFVYDLRGLKCPLPVFKTAKRLKQMAANQALTILSDDPLADCDLTDLCAKYSYKHHIKNYNGYIAFTIFIA